MNLSKLVCNFHRLVACGGHLEVNAHHLKQSKQPKRPQNVCRLTQCNCHALSTEAPETLWIPHPPCLSHTSLSLSLVAEFSGLTSSNLSRSRLWQNRFFWTRPRWNLGEGRWQFFFLWVKYAQNTHKNFTAEFRRKFRRTSSTPSAWLEIKISPLLSKFRRVQVGRFQHPATLLQRRSQTHELVDTLPRRPLLWLVNSRSCLSVWNWSYLQSGTGWPV